MTDENLVQDLLDNYIYQKEELLRRAGAKAVINRDRMATLMRPRIEKMAVVVEGWDVKPDILMNAVFDWARYNKHPDGPMPNMLASVKYLTKALGNYLQVPYEIVVEKRCMALFLERMEFEFDRFRNELERAGVTDLTTATSYPLETRYLMAVQNLDRDSAFYMAQELLEIMGRDKRVAMWLEHRGVRYEAVAEQFNKRKNRLQ